MMRSPEDHFKARLADQEAREKGAARLYSFLEKALGAESLVDITKLLERFRDLDEKGFKDLLSRLNGVILGAPAKERVLFTGKESHVESVGLGPDGRMQTRVEFVFPPAAKREAMMGEAFEKLSRLVRQTLNRGDKTLQQTLARSLYMVEAYLHPHPEGNGRSARVLYYLTSPRVEKDHKHIKNDMAQLMEKVPQGLYRFHQEYNLAVFEALVENQYNVGADNPGNCRLTNVETPGFDSERLGFLAVWSRIRNNDTSEMAVEDESGALILDWRRVPEEVKLSLNAGMNRARENFTRVALGASLNPDDEWGDHLQKPFDEAFTFAR